VLDKAVLDKPVLDKSVLVKASLILVYSFFWKSTWLNVQFLIGNQLASNFNWEKYANYFSATDVLHEESLFWTSSMKQCHFYKSPDISQISSEARSARSPFRRFTAKHKHCFVMKPLQDFPFCTIFVLYLCSSDILCMHLSTLSLTSGGRRL
jgi:hypothetical protein